MRMYDRLGRQIVSTDAVETCWILGDDALTYYAIGVKLMPGVDPITGLPALIPTPYVNTDISGNARVKNGKYQIRCDQTGYFHYLGVKLVAGIDPDTGTPMQIPTLYVNETGET